MPRAHDISICLISSPQHKARPDLTDDSGFWLRAKAEAFISVLDACRALPSGFQGFLLNGPPGAKCVRFSRPIVSIEEGPGERGC